MKIITHYIYPPIPTNRFDWTAITDNYEPGDVIGYGPTKEEAIEDLKRLLDETEQCKEYWKWENEHDS